MKFTFSQTEHLKSKREFSLVLKKGTAHKIKAGKLYALGTESPSKVGFIVGKKVGHAPYRNRIRRLWKEAFRLERQQFRQPLSLVIQIFPGYEAPPLEQIRLTLRGLRS